MSSGLSLRRDVDWPAHRLPRRRLSRQKRLSAVVTFALPPNFSLLRVVRPHHLPAAPLTATNDLPEGDTGVAWVISPKQESL